MHEIQVAWCSKVVHEFTELGNPYRSCGDICAATHEIEQSETQEARKALIDDFEGGHAPPYDALLRRQVIGAETRISRTLFDCRGSTAHSPEESIHLLTRKEIISHGVTESQTK